MNAEPQPTPRQSRGTVVMMPSRAPQPAHEPRPSPPAHEAAETGDEPGYGHGV